MLFLQIFSDFGDRPGDFAIFEDFPDFGVRPADFAILKIFRILGSDFPRFSLKAGFSKIPAIPKTLRFACVLASF